MRRSFRRSFPLSALMLSRNASIRLTTFDRAGSLGRSIFSPFCFFLRSSLSASSYWSSNFSGPKSPRFVPRKDHVLAVPTPPEQVEDQPVGSQMIVSPSTRQDRTGSLAAAVTLTTSSADSVAGHPRLSTLLLCDHDKRRMARKRRSGGTPYLLGCDEKGKPLDPNYWWKISQG
jgi:hypothetical protein